MGKPDFSGEPITHCRLCGNTHLENLGSLGTLSLTGHFPASPDENVPRLPLDLVHCSGGEEACGLVQLGHAFDPRLSFCKGYGFLSGLNPAIGAHLKSIADEIIAMGILNPGDTVLDIGSNDGTFLSFFPDRVYRLAGIDPAAKDLPSKYPGECRVIPDFFSLQAIKEAGLRHCFRVITAFSVFYDTPHPETFIKDALSLLDDPGVIVLEVGYWPEIMRDGAYDVICHEHAAYYSLRQIIWLCERVGLKIISCQMNPFNGGSLRVTLARKGKERTGFLENVLSRILEEELSSGKDCLRTFFERSSHNQKIIREYFEAAQTRKKKIYGYGASTKGNVILQYCRLGPADLLAVADINPAKWGRMTPGSNIPIIPEDEARRGKPDVFFVLPWHLRDYIIEKEKAFIEQGGELVFPLPRFSIVNKNNRGESGS